MTDVQSPVMAKWKIWLLAARPKTLWAAFSPVLMGLALAIGEGAFSLWIAFLCFLISFVFQVGTNFCNDYFDFIKGTDNKNRVGPLRVTQAGLLKPVEVRNATIVSFALAGIISLLLVLEGGWWIALLGASGIASGVLYTAGPKPLGYIGLGDLFVLIYFGPVATAGTEYLITGQWSLLAVLAGFCPGLLSVGILVMNNLRDLEGDRESGKRTLAVRFGVRFSEIQYALCLFLPLFIVLALVFMANGEHWGSLGVFVLAIPAWKALKRVKNTRSPAELIPMLGVTSKLLLLFSLIFSIGWVFT